MHFYLVVGKLWRMYIWDLAWLNWTLQKPVIITAHANHVILLLLASEMLSASCRYMSGPNQSLTKNSHALGENWSRTGFALAFFCSISTFRLRELTKSGASCWRNQMETRQEMQKLSNTSKVHKNSHWCYLIAAYRLKKKHKGRLSSLTWT